MTSKVQPEAVPDGAAGSIPLSVLKLRIRNNIIDYLETAASPEEQRAYERRVPVAQVPNEMINWWEDCVPDADFAWFSEPEFSNEEHRAIERFHHVWNAVADDTPNPMPSSVDALIGTPAWQRLIEAATVALRVFGIRGRLAEDALM